MLKKIENIEEVLDFVYELNMDDRFRGYPKERTREECIKNLRQGFDEDGFEVIASYGDDEELQGVCVYFWQEEERYAQTNNMIIRDNFNVVADEFLCYFEEKLKGYEFFIPQIYTNIASNKYFENSNWDCIDDNIMTRITDSKEPLGEIHQCIELVNEDNYEEYGEFHDRFAIPLEAYYNSKNLKKEMAYFRILTFREEGKIIGCVFTKVKNLAEIFGIFVDEEYQGKGIIKELIKSTLVDLYKEFGSFGEILFFIGEESKEELCAAHEVGFKDVVRARCFKKKF